MNVKTIVKEFSKKYGQDAGDMEKLVLKYINKGMKPEKAVAKAFTDSGFGATITADIEQAQLKAVALGLTQDAIKSKAIKKALSLSWTGDGVTFSERLHGTTTAMREAMVKTIKDQIKIGSTIREISQALYDGYGYGRVIKMQYLPDYLSQMVVLAHKTELSMQELSDMLKAIRTVQRQLKLLGDTNMLVSYKNLTREAVASLKELLLTGKTVEKKNLEKAVYVAVQEKSRAIAERIARTESTRAYFDGFVKRYANDPLVSAYRWVLNTGHPVEDICDMYAEADFFGLGAGIYPKDQVPTIPVHPNCMCMLEPVYVNEVDSTKAVDNIKVGGLEWLASKSRPQREYILGIVGNDVFERTGLWEPYARSYNGFANPQSRLNK